MVRLFELLAEQRIVEALRRGEFEALPGAGKPLEFDDDPLLTPEQRMVNRVLKNAGFTPREIVLRKEIAALQLELRALPAGARRDELKRELALLLLQVAERRN